MKKLLIIAGLLFTAAQPAAANSNVKDSLNLADQMFLTGMNTSACTMVSNAIMVANAPDIFGPTNSSLHAEVARYARRCNLRF